MKKLSKILLTTLGASIFAISTPMIVGSYQATKNNKPTQITSTTRNSWFDDIFNNDKDVQYGINITYDSTNVLKDGWKTDDADFMKIYEKALSGFNTTDRNNVEKFILRSLSGAPSISTNNMILGDFSKTFKDQKSVIYLGQLIGWAIWNIEKTKKSDFDMSFVIKNATFSKSTDNKIKAPKISLEMEIFQNYTEHGIKKWTKKTLKIFEQHIPTNPYQGLNHIVDINEYTDGYGNIHFTDKKKEHLPLVKGHWNITGHLGLIPKLFYYYFTEIDVNNK